MCIFPLHLLYHIVTLNFHTTPITEVLTGWEPVFKTLVVGLAAACPQTSLTCHPAGPVASGTLTALANKQR